MKDNGQPNLELLLAILISDGAKDVEVEYDDHEWWVSVIEGNTALGVARYATEAEKRQVDAALDRLRKEKSINVNGKPYGLALRYKENFGDPSWRIRVSEPANQNRTNARKVRRSRAAR